MEEILLKFQNLIKKPLFRKIQFDYVGFYNFLKEYKDSEIFRTYSNKIDLERDYCIELNNILENLFTDLIENLLTRDARVLEGAGLSQIQNILEDNISKRNFNKLLEALNIKINLSHFQKLSIWLKDKFRISVYSLSVLSILITILGVDINRKAYSQEINNPSSQNQEQFITTNSQPLPDSFKSEAYSFGREYNMPQEYFDLLDSVSDLSHLQLELFKLGIKNGMKNKYFELIISTPNLTNDQAWAFKSGAENKMDKWYFELIISTPNLTKDQAWAFKSGAENKMDKWYFELIISTPNLTNDQAWAFYAGANGKMDKWYFELIISTPNLTKYQAWAFYAGANGKMDKWYFEQIPKLTNDQAWAFYAGANGKMDKWYFELIISTPNLTKDQARAFDAGANGKMDKWYFELIISTPNLTKDQARAFDAGANGKMDKWYFELIISTPNLTKDQARAFDAGANGKMDKWYFELIISTPNLTNDQARAFDAGANGKMDKWYFELIISTPNLTKDQAWAFYAGAKNKMDKWYFDLILNKLKTQIIEDIDDHNNKNNFGSSIFSLVEILNILVNSNIEQEKLNNITSSFRDTFYFYVNELHNDSSEDRKKPFLNANSRILYILLSYGGELYTSSFRDVIFPLFKQKVDQEGFFNLIDKVDKDKKYYNNLIYHLSSYGLLDEIIPNDEISQQKFIKGIFDNFMSNNTKDRDSLISLVSIIETFSDISSSVKKNIFSYALDIYPSLKPLKSTFIAYMILENEEFVKHNFNHKISHKLKEELEILRPLKSGEISEILNQNENFLQNNELKTIQIFYSDDDGILSLNSFIQTVKYHKYSFFYINENGEKVKIENPTHSKVSSLKIKTITAEKIVNGIRILHQVRIYDDSYESFYSENFNKNSSYISWIHRGHSYHFDKTFNPYTGNFQRDKPMILILGSCGSFNNVVNLFEQSRSDKFFATQSIGTLIINNSLILNLFESIANTKGEISWKKVNSDLERDIFDKDRRGENYQTPYSLPMRMLQLFNLSN